MGSLIQGFLIGYSLNIKAFRVYNLETKRVEENLHVNFLGNKPNVAGKGHAWMFDLDYLTNFMNYEPVSLENQASKSVGPKEANNSAGTQANDDQGTTSEEINLHDKHFVLTIWSAYSTTVKSSEDKIQKTTACKTSEKPIEPKKIYQALKDESWVDVINKKDKRGVVVRNKARLVAQGHRQEEGIDYDEVFGPVARIETIRIFLAFASYMNFIVYQMDVKSAFLYGTIDEEVYVTQPPGFVDPKFPNKVYKVVKALHGLHQAPRAWYATLSTFLEKSGYRRGAIDKTLFIKQDKKDIILVKQKDDGIFISQDKYVAEILKKFDFLSVKTASTPIETQNPLVKDEEVADVDVHLYRSMIGSLMYLTASRPDIMFAVCACSKFQNQLLDYGFNLMDTKIYIDNESTICIVKNPVFHSKTKHIEIQNHFIRDAYEKKLIQVLKIHTDDNVADLLTKAFDVSSKELASPKQITLRKDESNPLIVDSLLKTIWSSMHHVIAMKHWLFQSKRLLKFNFSRYILLSLVKNIEAGVPFYMFLRFVQLIVDHPLGDMSRHQDIYNNPLLSKKVFANMKRVGIGFSRVITPLFENMLVPAAEEVSQAQDDVSIPTEPSTSKPHKKHKSKKQQPIAPLVPSPAPLPEHILHSPSNDPITDADKDSLKFQEFMDLCTRLSNKVLDLESKVIDIKFSFTDKIEKLKDRGRMIEDMDEDVEVNLEEAQAKAYNLDLQQSEKVLSMQVVTTIESTTTTTADQVPKASAPRKRRGVVIQDPKETAASVIVHTEVKPKDKGKGILVKEPKPLKRQAQI
nr:hypothetical protein [Tanacetum cinerariifolium]